MDISCAICGKRIKTDEFFYRTHGKDQPSFGIVIGSPCSEVTGEELYSMSSRLTKSPENLGEGAVYKYTGDVVYFTRSCVRLLAFLSALWCIHGLSDSRLTQHLVNSTGCSGLINLASHVNTGRNMTK